MNASAQGISGAVVAAQPVSHESSRERRFRIRESVDDEWGRSESLDPDDLGDIADEGMGHRGQRPITRHVDESGLARVRSRQARW
jgi:hypothetical protein